MPASTSPARSASASAVAVDEQRPGRHLLHVEHRADLAGDLRLDVVALVEHEADVAALVVAAAPHDLEQDAEQLERVGGADDQVVVGVEAGVEVERAEPAEPQQLHDDELDVRARRVVAGVEAHDRPLAERDAVHVGRAPVGHVGGVERRLEELVLEHQPLVRRRGGRRPAASESARRSWRSRRSAWPGVVEAVGQPDLEVAAAGDVHDVDAVEGVARSPSARTRSSTWHRLPSM